MDHLLVDGSANRVRKAVIPFKGGKRARITNHLLGSAIDFQSSDTGLDHLAQGLKHEPYQLPRGSHLVQLFLRLRNNHSKAQEAQQLNRLRKANSSDFAHNDSLDLFINNFRRVQASNSKETPGICIVVY